MFGWTRFQERHEIWLKRFWRGRLSAGPGVGMADGFYKFLWLLLLLALARREPAAGLITASLLLLVHPVLPWRWKGVAVAGGLLAWLHPLLGLGWLLSALVLVEVALYQTYEMLLFFPAWGLWSVADLTGNPLEGRWFLMPWAVLAYGWAQKLAEPPLLHLLRDETFHTWLEANEEEIG